MNWMWTSKTLQAVAFAFVLSVTISVWAAPESIPKGTWEDAYDQGVQYYRDGEFDKARKVFQQVTQEVPESIEGHYYYAITLAQLGRIKEARKSYETVMTLAPNSDTAELAKQGIEYLPSPQALDAPPKFHQPKAMASATSPGPGFPETPTTPTAPGSNDMNPQQLMQMMMMGMSGGNKGGFNPMMIPFLQNMNNGQNNAADPQNQTSPEVFKTMMMNQMMENFTPFSDKNDD